ncbi:MAG TPA: ISNCY family transposase [Candidatus Saccharimonadales bacterium]|nr:ISNCY family transposase [Candidatus Saccharimonadales bacterium]
MTQRDRDRLVVLKKTQKKLIAQKQAAGELQLTERHVRRLLKALAAGGDKAVVHALRGRPSNRRLSEEVRQKAVAILSLPEWKGFGPTLASYHLAKDHGIRIGREALRQMMSAAGLWRAKQQKVGNAHVWRPRRSCRGELVQWDTSGHDWLEGRGEKLYLISMIDDATSELLARFVRSDSTAENMRLLATYLERNGRPVAFYTDKASLFRTAPKVRRDQRALPREEEQEMPPTQIGRALRELQIVWIAAHSPQAKGRVERGFGTAQDRLVKGMRLAGVSTLEQANRYLEEEYLTWWNENLTVAPASAADAHRPLGPDHDVRSALSHVEQRRILPDYTFRNAGRKYRILPGHIHPGMRGGTLRVEQRLDGSMAVRFRDTWLEVAEFSTPLPNAAAQARKADGEPSPGTRATTAERTRAWRESGRQLFSGGLSVGAAASIDRTRTRHSLE